MPKDLVEPTIQRARGATCALIPHAPDDKVPPPAVTPAADHTAPPSSRPGGNTRLVSPRRSPRLLQPGLAVALTVTASACFTGAADLDAWRKDGSPDGSDAGGSADGSAGNGGGDGAGDGDGSSVGPATLIDDLTGMVFHRIEPSSFEMGCTAGQSDCESDESPVMPVTLTYAHYMGATEVTQAQFEAAMGYNPSNFNRCATCPVEEITWHEAAALSNALSAAAGLGRCYPCSGSGTNVECDAPSDLLSCEGYRLPTEAEWESAARCGADTLYVGGDDVDEVAWIDANSGAETHPVGRKSANACGQFDMSGNVWEWVSDWYGVEYYRSAERTDPSGPPVGSRRGVRGGSYFIDPSYARVARRGAITPSDRGDSLGVRLLRTAP